jgi:hypothetical protein
MLNFSLLKSQINSMIREKKEHEERFLKKLGVALKELNLKAESWDELSRKVNLSKTSWLVADFFEPLNRSYPLPPCPPDYKVFASDGSQIFPDRNEALPCYLINIGSVFLQYGADAGARLSSFPSFFYKDEDRFIPWDGRKVPADAMVISEKRTLMEFREVLRLVEECKNRENSVALFDGTLILWRLEGTPEDFKNEIIKPFINVLERLRTFRVPIAGYISFPGGTDVINALRVGLCPDRVSYCNQCPYTDLPELPCASIEEVTDRVLFSRVLNPGERSVVFKSSSKILDYYGEHCVHFFYLNVGEEIVRIEVPRWVVEDRGLLELVHSVVFDQAKKGGGYPVSLSEAHEQAVVRAKDREFFFELIREALVRSGFKVTVSRKGMSKRGPRI